MEVESKIIPNQLDKTQRRTLDSIFPVILPNNHQYTQIKWHFEYTDFDFI
jgi:hypothetical protein